MLCEVCRSIGATLASEVNKGSLHVYRKHHSTFAELVASAKEGCELCSAIQKEGHFSCAPWSNKYPVACYSRRVDYNIDVKQGTIQFYQAKYRRYISLDATFEMFIQHGMFIDSSQSENL